MHVIHLHVVTKSCQQADLFHQDIIPIHKCLNWNFPWKWTGQKSGL